MDDFKAYILSTRIANEKSAAFYVYWVRGFYRYFSKHPDDGVTQEEVEKYLAYLAKRKEDWQVEQASDAIQLYLFHKRKSTTGFNREYENINEHWEAVALETRRALRLRHRSHRTEEAYLGWLWKYYQFLEGKPPTSLDSTNVKDFMTYLAVEKNVAELTLTLQKLRILQIRGVKGEAVVNYRELLRTRRRRTGTGDAVSSTFPKGRRHDKLNGLTWKSQLVISRSSLELRKDPCYYCFLGPLSSLLCNER